MIGRVEPVAASVEDGESLEQVRPGGTDLVFVDAPQALVPGKN